MKFKKIICLVTLIALCVSIFSGCGSKTSETDKKEDITKDSANSDAKDNSQKSEETLVIKFANVVAADHPYNAGAEKFKEILESTAPSPVNVEIFANGQLGGERELAESLQLGTVDIAIIPGVISNFAPTLGVLDMPYLFRDKEHAYKVLDGEIGQKLADELSDTAGFYLLSYWENGWRNMTNSKRAVTVPNDVAGLTMRVPENIVYQAYFEELGANVVAMAFTELYTALQQKTVDGQENPVALIATNKLYETQKYLSLTEHFYGAAHVCISGKTWDKLSEDMKKAIKDAAAEAAGYERKIMQDLENTYLEEITASGTVVNDIDKSLFLDAAQKTWSRFDKEYGEMIKTIQEVK